MLGRPSEFPSFLRLNNTLLSGYITFRVSIHPLMDAGGLHLLTGNNTAVSMVVHVPLLSFLLGVYRKWNCRTISVHVYFLRNHIFHIGRIVLRGQQQYTGRSGCFAGGSHASECGLQCFSK